MRRGFSFIEVLFAVMILGIGFIMIAAIFPVAIQQTQATGDDVAAGRVQSNAKSYLDTIKANIITPATATVSAANMATITATNTQFPGKVISFRETSRVESAALVANPYLIVRGNQIDSSNPRYAWIPLYKRDGVWNGTTGVGSITANIYVFVVASRNRSMYSYGHLNASSVLVDSDVFRYSAGNPTDANGNPPATLEPRLVRARFYLGPPDRIVFQDAPPAAPALPYTANSSVVVDGAYVIVSDDPTMPRSNGAIFRIGSAINAGTGTWELQPGSDLAAASLKPTLGSDVAVFVVSSGWSDSNNPGTYEGATQDIQLYSIPITPP